eukprot:Rhum_TRINITY_DN17264_c0_g1::Rhum_TRINITY_DN17264_c0_g1_i1::g.165619::m.165619
MGIYICTNNIKKKQSKSKRTPEMTEAPIPRLCLPHDSFYLFVRTMYPPNDATAAGCGGAVVGRTGTACCTAASPASATLCTYAGRGSTGAAAAPSKCGWMSEPCTSDASSACGCGRAASGAVREEPSLETMRERVARHLPHSTWRAGELTMAAKWTATRARSSADSGVPDMAATSPSTPAAVILARRWSSSLTLCRRAVSSATCAARNLFCSWKCALTKPPARSTMSSFSCSLSFASRPCCACWYASPSCTSSLALCSVRSSTVFDSRTTSLSFTSKSACSAWFCRIKASYFNCRSEGTMMPAAGCPATPLPRRRRLFSSSNTRYFASHSLT